MYIYFVFFGTEIVHIKHIHSNDLIICVCKRYSQVFINSVQFYQINYFVHTLNRDGFLGEILNDLLSRIFTNISIMQELLSHCKHIIK